MLMYVKFGSVDICTSYISPCVLYVKNELLKNER